jgi:hypothetical protein
MTQRRTAIGAVLQALGALALASLAFAFPPLAQAQNADADALSLSSAEEQKTETPTDRKKIFIEGAAGIVGQRYRPVSRDLSRASLDAFYTTRLSPSWRATLSDRLDYVHPNGASHDWTVNSLREAYVSGQREGSGLGIDIGRINLRSGPAYGYNPTDFFRDHSLRTFTTVNPFTLRESRLGTVAVRGQQLWSGTSLSAVYAPKLDNHPSDDGASLDLGSTNNRNRGMLSLSHQASERLNGQLLVYKESSLPAQLGASVTALLTDAAVVHGEWSRGREPSLLGRLGGFTEPKATKNRGALGLTYTTSTKLSLTAEYEYNGFALDRGDWRQLRDGNPAAFSGYVLQALQLQEIASRQAWFFFATQKDLGLKNLDLSALMRINGNDHSRLTWLELRYRWSKFDLALQVQQQTRAEHGEYAIIPYRRSAQLLGAYYF